MFQSYYDTEHKCIITSKSEEATVNGYAQEINLKEIKEIIEQEKEAKRNRCIFYRIFKILKRRVKNG